MTLKWRFLLIDMKTKLEMYLPMKVMIKVAEVINTISLVKESEMNLLKV